MIAPGWWRKRISRRGLLRYAATAAAGAALAGTGRRTAGSALARSDRGTSDPVGIVETRTPIKHLVVLMQENHTFDNYFGTYPGADGIPEDAAMPADPDDAASPLITPFHIGDNDVQMDDPDHSSGTHEEQFNLGRMDGFVKALNTRAQDGRLAMGHYDVTDLPYYWNVADEYVLFDRFFSSVASSSFPNHVFWVTGQRGLEGEGAPSPDGPGLGDLLTIFDRLQEKGISWKFYVQNYDPGITYRTVEQADSDRGAQVVWVPLLNYARFIDDPELSSHIVDLSEYFRDLQEGTLPAVAYMVPSGASEHPPAHPRSGERFVRTLINELMRSPNWKDSAFLWTYDDWGGWYDHVPPPQVDEDGYGFRVPALLVSSLARRGYIDHTELDFASILKFIEENWDVEPLARRDAQAASFMGAFDFSQTPRDPAFISSERASASSEQPTRREVVYAAYAFAAALPAAILAWAGRSVLPFGKGAAEGDE